MITTAPSPQDLYNIARAALLVRNPNLKVVAGDTTDAFLWGMVTVASRVLGFGAARFLATFLDGAANQDLTNLARDRGVARDPGDYAIGQQRLQRASFAAGAGVYPAGSRVASQADASGKFSIYTTKQDVVWGATDLGPFYVDCTCTKTGPDGNVDANTVTRFIDQPFDLTIQTTNLARYAGGAVVESDEDLRDQVRGFFLTQARGTRDALVYGAKTVAGVKRANVVPDYVTGLVTVYVSDADGNANQAMVDAVQFELENFWADAGDPISVVGATLVLQSVDLSLTVRVGTDQNNLLNSVKQAVIARVARLAPGETLYRDMISAAAREVDKQNILSVNVNNPATNVAPSTGEVLRTDVGHITFS